MRFEDKPAMEPYKVIEQRIDFVQDLAQVISGGHDNQDNNNNVCAVIFKSF